MKPLFDCKIYVFPILWAVKMIEEETICQMVFRNKWNNPKSIFPPVSPCSELNKKLGLICLVFSNLVTLLHCIPKMHAAVSIYYSFIPIITLTFGAWLQCELCKK